MIAIAITILAFLVGIEKDDRHKTRSRKQMQYEQNTGCYLIDF